MPIMADNGLKDVDTLSEHDNHQAALVQRGRGPAPASAVMEASESMSGRPMKPVRLMNYRDLRGEQLAGEQTEALSSASLDLRNALAHGDDINEVSDAVANMRKVLEECPGG